MREQLEVLEHHAHALAHRAQAARRRAGAAAPSNSISPPSSVSSPLVQRSSVDLPEPDGPIRQTTSPACTSQRHAVQRREVAEALDDVAIAHDLVAGLAAQQACGGIASFASSRSGAGSSRRAWPADSRAASRSRPSRSASPARGRSARGPASRRSASSPTAITETSEVSLNSDTQVLASTGSTRRSACGKITLAQRLPAAHAERERGLALALADRVDAGAERLARCRPRRSATARRARWRAAKSRGRSERQHVEAPSRPPGSAAGCGRARRSSRWPARAAPEPDSRSSASRMPPGTAIAIVATASRTVIAVPCDERTGVLPDHGPVEVHERPRCATRRVEQSTTRVTGNRMTK